MDKTLGLMDDGRGGGGGGSGGGLEVQRMEKDYMGLSSEASSYSNEAEIELGLGLSIRSGRGGVGKGKGKGASAWGEFGRILTAQDLPNCLSVRAAESVGPVGNGPSSAGVSSQVVGWPPVAAYRMNNLVNQSKVSNVDDESKGVGAKGKKENSKKKINYQSQGNDDNMKEKGLVGFVKVYVEGLAIGRKVDMNAHTSYESLAQALMDMFFTSSPPVESKNRDKEHARQPPQLLDAASEFVLTYEDKEGDWMLVGDVPWRMFLSTVKRLRIMRTSEANVLAAIPQENHERQKGKPVWMQKH